MKPAEYYCSLPLYSERAVTEADKDEVASLLYFKGKLDMHCIQCQKETTFASDDYGYDTWSESFRNLKWSDIIKTNLFHKTFTCLRCGHIVHYFSFINTIHTVMSEAPFFKCKITFQKIGQFPSLADFADADSSKYQKTLGKPLGVEFKKAIGLAAHGVGIGSFVYLRRIFEHLIEEAHHIAKQSSQWNEEAYLPMRMDEKIKALKEYLPTFLVDNRSLYGILSKGIHELSENECLAIFPTVKVGIELILDDKIAIIERQQKLDLVKKTITSVHQQLSNKE